MKKITVTLIILISLSLILPANACCNVDICELNNTVINITNQITNIQQNILQITQSITNLQYVDSSILSQITLLSNNLIVMQNQLNTYTILLTSNSTEVTEWFENTNMTVLEHLFNLYQISLDLSEMIVENVKEINQMQNRIDLNNIDIMILEQKNTELWNSYIETNNNLEGLISAFNDLVWAHNSLVADLELVREDTQYNYEAIEELTDRINDLTGENMEIKTKLFEAEEKIKYLAVFVIIVCILAILVTLALNHKINSKVMLTE